METTMEGFFHYINTITHHSGQSNYHSITLLVSDKNSGVILSGFGIKQQIKNLPQTYLTLQLYNAYHATV